MTILGTPTREQKADIIEEASILLAQGGKPNDLLRSIAVLLFEVANQENQRGVSDRMLESAFTVAVEYMALAGMNAEVLSGS